MITLHVILTTINSGNFQERTFADQYRRKYSWNAKKTPIQVDVAYPKSAFLGDALVLNSEIIFMS